jgi:hypothetical protein
MKKDYLKISFALTILFLLIGIGLKQQHLEFSKFVFPIAILFLTVSVFLALQEILVSRKITFIKKIFYTISLILFNCAALFFYVFVFRKEIKD